MVYGKKRPVLVNLALLVISLVVIAAAAEVYLRVQYERARERIRAGLDETALCTTASDDPRLLYTYIPGRCGTNARGFPGPDVPAQKPDSTFRIVLIGDSVAQGRDVAADSSFARVLERMYNAAAGDVVRFEVIVLARIGYSTSQEIVLLEEEAFRYDPDLILWSYCLNDPAHPVFHNANGQLGEYYYHPPLRLFALASAFAFRVKQKLRGRGCPGEFHEFVHCAFWDEVEGNLRRIGDVVREHNINVFFIIHPIFVEGADSFHDYPHRDLHHRLAAAAKAAGLRPIDILPAFEPYTPAELQLHRTDYHDPWHLSPLGHRVTAEAILEGVRSRGAVQ